jgi:isoleucyl-tRNA synthetase
MDYNKTLKLPKTDFSMRAGLAKKEPEILEKWENERYYYEMIKRNAGKKKYILHDGPPYANGSIHIGTSMNKILKDIIVKSKNMSGYCSDYVPGWDTHGLPIELKALKSEGVDAQNITPFELRQLCKKFALENVDTQMKQFKRLGCWGDFDHPYLTLRPEYEARQIEVFGKMALDGYMYKGLKPVYWCADCQTALAEAEIEYKNDPCVSIYVKFNITDDLGKFSDLGIDLNKAYAVIWTTTTWTIPGNLAICLGPDYEYTFVKVNDEYLLMANELVSAVMSSVGITEYETVGMFKGSELENIKTQHPIYDRVSPLIIGSHVTLGGTEEEGGHKSSVGTGCVHTAPGYGVEDFEVCKNYPEIGIIVCVDGTGLQTAEANAPDLTLAGLDTDKTNKTIFEYLQNKNALFASEKIEHKYPHCWRCKEPIIYRATEQWFCSVQGFKNETMKAIESVNWNPVWGKDRIKGMCESRSDWCISRQRNWGVPIPIVYCKDCGKAIITENTIKSISAMFREKGADSWWTTDTSEFINETCECGCKEFVKEYDIMDVWFDSGCSHTSVLDEYDELNFPADLYLEGADQYRGWFQSSLLTSVVYNGCAPYKNVLTHGWTVDGKGEIMSKSKGNGVAPEDVVNVHGADILRIWVASTDYHNDMRISPEIINQKSDAYKKIRNTARFILGNLGDFNKNDKVELEEIDKYILVKLNNLIDKVTASYESFDFWLGFGAIYNFCTIDLSNFYLDIIKDRLYCEIGDKRKAAQYTIYTVLSAVTRLLAPVITFTAEEIWSYLDENESVFFNQFPEKSDVTVDTEKWEFIQSLRQDVQKKLEEKRTEKVIGSSLEAEVTVTNNNPEITSELLQQIFIVSKVNTSKEPTEISVKKADGGKCERCWNYSKTVGEDSEHPTLCKRCADVVKTIEN